MQPVHLLFWAKTDRKNSESEWIRPLWSHLIDVAAVAEVLWDRVLPSTFKREVISDLGCTEDQARSFLSFMAGMHDIGKAIPSFQYLHVPSRKRLDDVRLSFPKALLRGGPDATRVHHAHASHALLRYWYSGRNLSNDGIFDRLAFLLGLHHSKFPYLRMSARRTPGRHGEVDSWGKAQLDLIDCIVEILDPYIPTTTVITTWYPWTYLFLGFVIYADWIASIGGEDRFPLYDGDDLHAYLPIARAHASALVKQLYIDRNADIIPREFGEIFTDSKGRPFAPNPFQQAIIDLTKDNLDNTPSMTIIEAPTGSGKTEAGFYTAFTQQSRTMGRGIHVVVPTQAMSNALLPRFEQALSRSHHPGSFVNTLLVHGQSDLDPRQKESIGRISLLGHIESIMQDDDHDGAPADGAIVATARWFLPRKRALLVPFGIGTIDQVLMAAMQSQFFFLRLLGLAGKTVIFDEVHAYDTYVLTILCRLVQWLRAVGSDVIILSATLPDRTKKKLLDAWTGTTTATIDGDQSHYPALTIAQADRIGIHGLPKPSPRTIQVRYLDYDQTHRSVVTKALEAYHHGAAVAIICNTVDRSIAVFRALLKEAGYESAGAQDLDIFVLHEHMPHGIRVDKEDRILLRFGKDHDGDRRGIVVGTQILEQSLDIDFDVMFSDIAPIDLLIQCAGRLQRHDHHRRPGGYEQATLYVVMPPVASSEPSFTHIASVYEETVMLRTWKVLHTIDSFESADDIRRLIGSVYDDIVDGLASGMEHALLEQETARTVHAHMAQRILIPEPWNASSIQDRFPMPDDEKMEGRLRTKRSETPTRIICLHADHSGALFLDPDLRHPFDADLLSTTDGIRKALGNEVSISSTVVVQALQVMTKDENDRSVRHWKAATRKCIALRHLTPLVFHDLVWRAGDSSCRVHFDSVIGLEVS